MPRKGILLVAMFAATAMAQAGVIAATGTHCTEWVIDGPHDLALRAKPDTLFSHINEQRPASRPCVRTCTPR